MGAPITQQPGQITNLRPRLVVVTDVCNGPAQ
jgi:hypothetical protein